MHMVLKGAPLFQLIYVGRDLMFSKIDNLGPACF